MARVPLAICPVLNISWNDLQLHSLDRQRSYTPSRDEKDINSWDVKDDTKYGKGPPLPFVPFLTSHEMICNYIVWIDRDHTLLLEMKRDHFMKCKGRHKWQGSPLPFVPFLTSHEMICNYIVWIDRDLHSYIEMKRDRFMTCYGDTEWRVLCPCIFVPPLTSHGMICDYIVWIDRDLHSSIEMKRDHFMTC